MGEDRFHREHNAFGHNGAYRDHRWETGWGGHDARRQAIIDEQWRYDQKKKMQEDKKKLRQESSVIHGPRNEAQLEQEYHQYQQSHDLQAQHRTPFNTDVQSDWERRRYEERYAQAYPEPELSDEVKEALDLLDQENQQQPQHDAGISESEREHQLNAEIEQMEAAAQNLQAALQEKRKALTFLHGGERVPEDELEDELEQLETAPVAADESGVPQHVQLQMAALFSQVDRSKKGMDLHDGRRLASVLHENPSSGDVFALFDEIGAEPCGVTEDLFAHFVLNVSNHCFGELHDPETLMIDRIAAQEKLGTALASPSCTPQSTPNASKSNSPQIRDTPPPIPEDTESNPSDSPLLLPAASPKPKISGLSQSLDYSQFVTYVTSEMRRAISKGNYHLTLASLYQLATSS